MPMLGGAKNNISDNEGSSKNVEAPNPKEIGEKHLNEKKQIFENIKKIGMIALISFIIHQLFN